MESIEYVGLDVHKKKIAFCVKTQAGEVMERGKVAATRGALTAGAAGRRGPGIGALEATLFTGWIYDHLKPHARELKVAHPAMLKAIAASKKKNDRVDAEKIADLLRCDLLPECWMAPGETRELRRVLRYRHLIVREAVRMKNKSAGLLMEVGAEYEKRRLHGKRYFARLTEELGKVEEIPESVVELLKLSRGATELFEGMQRRLVSALREHPALRERVARLMTVPSVGEVTALTWALETGDPHRFASIDKAVSYCGLCSAQRESGDKASRGPLSKQRNAHLQRVLIEVAKLAPRHSPELAELRERELRRGNKNRATLAVARKLVAWLMAVDKSGREFCPEGKPKTPAAHKAAA